VSNSGSVDFSAAQVRIGGHYDRLGVIGMGGDLQLAQSSSASKIVLGTINTTDTEQVFVLGDGRLGIGTSTPTAKLEVVGQIVSKLPTALAPTGTTQTLNFSTGNIQTLDLGAAAGDVTVTISQAVAGGSYAVKIIQGATPYNVTWPANVKWSNGIPMTLSTANGAIDLVSLFYDGTNFYAVGGTNFQ
jgi:hypothetical protein